jgi:hypothetical protein
MRCGQAVVLVFLCSGCNSGSEPQVEQKAIALTKAGDKFSVVFANEEDAQNAERVLRGETPKDFIWVAFDLPISEQALSAAPDGLTYNLESGSPVTFSQVYPGLCNPALGNYETCLLFESYTTGMSDLRGTIHLALRDGVATGSVAVDWQGYTDRFGEPLQWHQHGTSGNYTAPLARVQ